MEALKNLLNRLSSELILGALVAVLSILAAVSGYQGGMADSKQTEHNVLGQKDLTNANSEYLTANQMIVYDYQLFDGYYTATTPEQEEYYQSQYSEPLQAAIAANPDDIFTEAYYDEMYAVANEQFASADAQFDLAGKYNERGDALQLVLMISALAVAFAAWASLLEAGSSVRVVFAILSIVGLVYTIVLYVQVPGAPA